MTLLDRPPAETSEAVTSREESRPARAYAVRASPPNRFVHSRAFPFLLMLAGAVLVLHSAWTSPTGAIFSNSADAMQSAWFLSWTPHALLHGSNPLFTAHIAYPDGANLAWNASIPLLGGLLTPFTLILGPVFSFNLLLTLELALTGWCAYLAFCRYVEDRRAAFIGAVIVGFGPFEITQAAVGHANTAAGMFPAIALLLLDDILVRRRHAPWRLGAALGALAALQLYVWEETLAATAIMAAAGVVILALFNRHALREPAARLGKALVAAVLPFLLIGGPLLLYEFGGPLIPRGALLPANSGDAELLNLVVPNKFGYITGAHPIDEVVSPLGFEPGLYLGAPLILLLAVTAVVLWRRRVDVRLFTLLLVVAVIFALGGQLHIDGRVVDIPLPWDAMSRLPLLGNLLPVRFALFADLFAGLLLAVALDASRRLRLNDARNAVRVMAAVAVLCLLPAFDLASKPLDDPYVFQTSAAARIPEGSVVLVAPIAGDITDPHGITIEPMLWQALEEMRFRMPEGYVRHPNSDGLPATGPAQTALLDAMVTIDQSGVVPQKSDALRDRLRAELRQLGVGTVVVGPMKYQKQMLEFVGWLSGGPPAADGNVYVFAPPV